MQIQTRSVRHLFLTLVEMNVILNVRVSIHFQDVTCLHLSSFLKGMATGKKLASVLFSKLARAWRPEAVNMFVSFLKLGNKLKSLY